MNFLMTKEQEEKIDSGSFRGETIQTFKIIFIFQKLWYFFWELKLIRRFDCFSFLGKFVKSEMLGCG